LQKGGGVNDSSIGLKMINRSDLAIVIPTLNPGRYAKVLLQALRTQGIDFSKVYIIDSQSDDGSMDLFRAVGCVVYEIGREKFDHGGTRNLGLDVSHHSKIVLFLTQDAVPSGAAMLEHLLLPFQDPQIALVCGRQLARDGAGAIEAHARQFNYPGKSNERTMPSARTLGIKAVFNSNSFAAYRREALVAVGGFPTQIIMGEDQAAAAKLLLAGWTIAYKAEACVKHSHAYSVGQEFSRYFDIGIFHEQQRVLFAPFGTAGSEGIRYVVSELRYLLMAAPSNIPEAILRTVAKLVGYKLGTWYRALPRAACRNFAMNKGFFSLPRLSNDGFIVSYKTTVSDPG
jgi:rhamnosyltransferase